MVGPPNTAPRTRAQRIAQTLRLAGPRRLEGRTWLVMGCALLVTAASVSLAGSLYEGPWYEKLWFGLLVNILGPLAILALFLLAFLAIYLTWCGLRGSVVAGAHQIASRLHRTGSRS